jgi:parallel beta-helix repeat protein
MLKKGEKLNKVASGIMLIMFLVGLLSLAFDIRPVKAEPGTIYIRADGSIDPSTAPISTVDNVTYTLTGNILSDADGIVVERDNIVVDGVGFIVRGTGDVDSKGIDLTDRNNVTIRNMKIKRFQYGVYLLRSVNNSIVGNYIANNYGGSGYTGIQIYLSSKNTLSGNCVANSTWGIFLSYSPDNKLRSNSMINNTRNFSVDGSSFSEFLNDVDVSNTVDSKPIYYWINKSDYAVPSEAGYIALINCSRITVQNMNFAKNGQGILLVHTTNSTITKNTVENNNIGIDLKESSGNVMVENNVTANSGWAGISLLSSSNNSLIGNNIIGNTGWGGVCFALSSNNSIIENNVKANGIYGVWLDRSSNNCITGNTITNNEDGILSLGVRTSTT